MDASTLALIRRHRDIAVRLGGEGKIINSQSGSAVTQVLSKHRAHMQAQRKHAYDFDFGNLELIPPEVFKMIFRQLIATPLRWWTFAQKKNFYQSATNCFILQCTSPMRLQVCM